MPTTSDDDDFAMNGRLSRAFRNPENREWARAYFDRHTHPGHSEPGERARHERHVEAVQQLQDDLARDHADAQYRANLAGTYAAPDAMRLEIEKTRSHPAYMDARHKDHADTVARVTYLYTQLYK